MYGPILQCSGSSTFNEMESGLCAFRDESRMFVCYVDYLYKLKLYESDTYLLDKYHSKVYDQ